MKTFNKQQAPRGACRPAGKPLMDWEKGASRARQPTVAPTTTGAVGERALCSIRTAVEQRSAHAAGWSVQVHPHAGHLPGRKSMGSHRRAGPLRDDCRAERSRRRILRVGAKPSPAPPTAWRRRPAAKPSPTPTSPHPSRGWRTPRRRARAPSGCSARSARNTSRCLPRVGPPLRSPAYRSRYRAYRTRSPACRSRYRACRTRSLACRSQVSGVPQQVSGMPQQVSGVPQQVSGVPQLTSGPPPAPWALHAGPPVVPDAAPAQPVADEPQPPAIPSTDVAPPHDPFAGPVRRIRPSEPPKRRTGLWVKVAALALVVAVAAAWESGRSHLTSRLAPAPRRPVWRHRVPHGRCRRPTAEAVGAGRPVQPRGARVGGCRARTHLRRDGLHRLRP